MKVYSWALILVALTMASCTPTPTSLSEQPVQVKITSTPISPSEQLAQITITSTPTTQMTQLSEINLDPILFQNGDLPNQYKSGQISYKWADDLPKMAEPENVVIQKVGWDISSGFTDDYVMIALFMSIDDLNNVFDEVIKKYSAKEDEILSVGDRSAFVMVSSVSGDGFLAFTRCKALVVIRTTGADVDDELLTSYAQRIDKRLKPLICQP